MLLGLHPTAFPKPRAEALNQSTSTTLQRKPLLSGECMSCSSVFDVFEPLMWSGKPEQQLFRLALHVVMIWQHLQWLGRLNQGRRASLVTSHAAFCPSCDVQHLLRVFMHSVRKGYVAAACQTSYNRTAILWHIQQSSAHTDFQPVYAHTSGFGRFKAMIYCLCTKSCTDRACKDLDELLMQA